MVDKLTREQASYSSPFSYIEVAIPLFLKDTDVFVLPCRESFGVGHGRLRFDCFY